tara:strand:- start:520 stop:963 length:444 start_codon:yes stop_codon:yes gene_type:complete
MSYSGRYNPTNPRKYKGNPMKIIFRSLWERKLMIYCDTNKNVMEWGSEEIIIPYRSPLDGRVHRYFPDFYMKVKGKEGIKKFIIEVKPKKYLTSPEKNPKTRSRQWLNEMRSYAVNQAKWKSARNYCLDTGMEFKILTEDHLNSSYK